MTIELGIAIAVIGCLVGLAGWVSGRDKKISGEAMWRGEVNGKLDVIVGIRHDVDGMSERITEHTAQIATVAASAASAHKRLDEHIRGSEISER